MIEDKIRKIMKKRPMMKMMVDDAKKRIYAVPHPDTVKELAKLFNAELKEIKAEVFWLTQAIQHIDDEVKDAKKWIK
jgi:hypothetical protein